MDGAQPHESFPAAGPGRGHVARTLALLVWIAFSATALGQDTVGVLDTTLGTIRIRLLPDKAPGCVAKWKDLVGSGFYDGTSFHRVIGGYLIQGGALAPGGGGSGIGVDADPGQMLPLEPGGRPMRRGIVGAARRLDVDRLKAGLPERATFLDSANGQIFILLTEDSSLDGKFTVFGDVIEGLDVAEKISFVPRDAWDRPVDPVRILRARVESPAPGATSAAAAVTPPPPAGDPKAATAPGGRRVMVRPGAGNVNTRSGPGAGFPVVAKVRPGAVLRFIREDAGWVQVALEQGRTAWIRADLTEPPR